MIKLKIDELPDQMVVPFECRRLLIFHVGCLLCPEYVPFYLDTRRSQSPFLEKLALGHYGTFLYNLRFLHILKPALVLRFRCHRQKSHIVKEFLGRELRSAVLKGVMYNVTLLLYLLADSVPLQPTNFWQCEKFWG